MHQKWILLLLTICAALLTAAQAAHAVGLRLPGSAVTGATTIGSTDSDLEPQQPEKKERPYISIEAVKAGVMVFAFVPIAMVESEGAKTAYPEGFWGPLTISGDAAVALADGTAIKFGDSVEINGKSFSAHAANPTRLLTIEPSGRVQEGGKPIFERPVMGDRPFSSIHAVRARVIVYLYAQVSTIEATAGVERCDRYIWGRRIESAATVALNNGVTVTIDGTVHVGNQELKGFDDPAKGVRRFAVFSPQVDVPGPLIVREDGASWVDNVTYVRMWSLEQRIRAYVAAHGRLPKVISEIPASSIVTNDTKDEWGKPIVYKVKNDTTAVLISHGRYGWHKGAIPFIERWLYLR